MTLCPVCEGTAVLLEDACPLCTGDSGTESACLAPYGFAPVVDRSAVGDESEPLFVYEDNGTTVQVPSFACNRFFTVELTMSGVAPPMFDIHIVLRSSVILVAGLDLPTARAIVKLVTDVPPQFIVAPDLPAISTLLQILGIAEIRQARIEVKGSRTAAEAICMFYDELCDSHASEEDFVGLIGTREVLPRVFAVEIESHVVLASLFLRVQEFYESPDPSIRGQCCSLKDHKARCREEEAFEYYLKWPGFNCPSWVFQSARNGALGPLEPRELALMASIDAAIGDTTSEYYVIGTCEGGTALHHEMAHGLYATNAQYRQKVQSILVRLPATGKAAMCKTLRDMGYCDDVDILTDEIQAYMADGDDLGGLCKKDRACQEVRWEIQQVFSSHAGVAIRNVHGDNVSSEGMVT